MPGNCPEQIKSGITFCETPCWVQCVAEIENHGLWFHSKAFHFIEKERGALERLRSTPLFCNSIGTWTLIFYGDEGVAVIIQILSPARPLGLPLRGQRKIQIIGIIVHLSSVVLAAECLLWERLHWTHKLYTWGERMRFLPLFLLPKSILQGKQGVMVCLMTRFLFYCARFANLIQGWLSFKAVVTQSQNFSM